MGDKLSNRILSKRSMESYRRPVQYTQGMFIIIDIRFYQLYKKKSRRVIHDDNR